MIGFFHHIFENMKFGKESSVIYNYRFVMIVEVKIKLSMSENKY